MTVSAAKPTAQLVAPDRLHEFAQRVLEKLGMPADDASIVADSMVWTGLRGKPTHSVIRLIQLASRARGGGLKLKNDWTPVVEKGGTTVLDARGTWGVIAGSRGMRIAVEKARTHGVGVTVARNCDNTGAMGTYPAIAITQRMVGLAITNTMPLMPAWGGAKKMVGNQAFSIGAPARRHDPLLLDMASASTSLLTIREHGASGEPLPPGLAVDAHGEPTTDAAAALAGMLLPMAGYRGYALNVMWEVFTGVLSGGRTMTEITGPDAVDRPTGNSLFLLALDPGAFMPYETFLGRVDALIDQLQASPAASGVDRVRVPGERGGEHERRNRERGIPVPAADIEKLRPFAAELGVRWPD